MGKKLYPPTNLEPMYLYDKYAPLRKAMYIKFENRIHASIDKQDLIGVIDELFLELVNEYNPNRGVDFPYYIKYMLNLRVYHHITSYQKYTNEVSTEEDLVVEDDSIQKLLDRVIDLNSLDPNILLGEKHRKLMVGILIEQKTLGELAEEEGVPHDTVHARLYFLLKRLRGEYKKQKDLYGDDMY